MNHEREGLAEEPEPSWSENTTPSSDNIEEIVRQEDERPRLPFKDLGSYPRHVRPAIRRRVHIHERVGRGHNIKAIQIATLEMRRNTEGSDASSSSNLTVITSVSSPGTSPWSLSGFVEEERDEDEYDINLDDQDEDMLLVPKLEPLDDDVDMNNMIASVDAETPSTSTSPITIKRPRGRPRKHPKVNPESVVKAAKGRSKTGCITCRRRKKKCDEARPGCMNCEKNSVTCEGYPQKTIWKNGKERAEEARLRRDSSVLLNIRLQPVIPGVETEGDKMFFEHYIFRLSGILTVETDTKHSFKNMLLQLALKHVGLMHSILALSSKHIDFRSPYGVKFLQEHPDSDIQTLEERSQFHHEMAMTELNAAIERQKSEDVADNSNVIIPAMYGQMICLVLETLADPNPTGQHRVHLEAYTNMIKEYPPEDQDFLRFIEEFFQYHISADELISLPEGRTRLGAVSDDWNLPAPIVQPESVRLLGVSDGLFFYMSKITNLRNKIRENIHNGIDPIVDYTSLYRTAEIDAGIREWTPCWPAGDSRDLAGLLYKQMMWIYLWRTVYPPRSSSWKPHEAIVEAVDNGIKLLAQFKPSDPSQTLILAPAFVIGCAAFEERQREPIRKAISVVKEYMHYKNSDTALKVLEEVWRLMDAKNEESWDWQSIAHRMGMDFLAT